MMITNDRQIKTPAMLSIIDSLQSGPRNSSPRETTTMPTAVLRIRCRGSGANGRGIRWRLPRSGTPRPRRYKAPTMISTGNSCWAPGRGLPPTFGYQLKEARLSSQDWDIPMTIPASTVKLNELKFPRSAAAKAGTARRVRVSGSTDWLIEAAKMPTRALTAIASAEFHTARDPEENPSSAAPFSLSAPALVRSPKRVRANRRPRPVAATMTAPRRIRSLAGIRPKPGTRIPRPLRIGAIASGFDPNRRVTAEDKVRTIPTVTTLFIKVDAARSLRKTTNSIRMPEIAASATVTAIAHHVVRGVPIEMNVGMSGSFHEAPKVFPAP